MITVALAQAGIQAAQPLQLSGFGPWSGFEHGGMQSAITTIGRVMAKENV